METIVERTYYMQFPTDVQVNNGTGKMSIGKVKRKGLDVQTTSERS